MPRRDNGSAYISPGYTNSVAYRIWSICRKIECVQAKLSLLAELESAGERADSDEFTNELGPSRLGAGRE
jgi:hypothetical protein